MSSPNPIRHISDTALWVAVYRAKESERPDAHFRDPFARKLAGERGLQIAASMQFAEKHSWSYVARTWLLDQVIEHELAQGTDMIINLAAGLDARPYRMKFPPALRWVEVDLPEMLEYKQGVLASDRPQCALERVPLDLRDVAARRALFQRLGNEARRALLISEGLIVYLDEEAVAELARDLAAPPSFRRWATDLISPALLKMLRKSIGVPLQGAGSPLIFAPRQGPDFFAGYGWRPLERHSLLKAGARLHRLSLGMRLVSLLPDPAGRKPDTPWGGVCVFENTAAARP